MVASVQVEVTRPSEKSGSFVLSADGSNQRVHEPQPTAHWLTRIIGKQVIRTAVRPRLVADYPAPPTPVMPTSPHSSQIKVYDRPRQGGTDRPLDEEGPLQPSTPGLQMLYLIRAGITPIANCLRLSRSTISLLQ
jgi:hypothetical protein